MLILAGAALAGYLITLIAFPAPLISRDRAVARVLGLPQPEAQKVLEEQGFKAKVEGEDPDPVIPAGHVVWQDPSPETALTQGTTIRLTTSTGPGPVIVPDVIAFELDQARQVLEAAGLRSGDVDTLPSASEAGVVINTRPATGASRPPGSTVDLVVSKGPADIRVPDVVGMKQEDARQRLEAAGLRVGTITSRSTRRGPSGIVVDQRPGGGMLSPREGRVNLFISN
jgi:serine/threonine-protein kinase